MTACSDISTSMNDLYRSNAMMVKQKKSLPNRSSGRPSHKQICRLGIAYKEMAFSNRVLVPK